MTVAQDVANIIARQVTEQLEEVQGMGIMTASDRKAVDDYVFNLFSMHNKNAGWTEGRNYSCWYKYLYYSLCGNYLQEIPDGECELFELLFKSLQTTRRVNRRAVVTYTAMISLCMRTCRDTDADINVVFQTTYTGNEPVSQEWVVSAFEEVLSVMRKTNKCNVCKKYKCDIVCCKDGVGICPECHVHARVKRALVRQQHGTVRDNKRPRSD